MGTKLAWTGLTFTVVSSILNWPDGFVVAGAILMVIGVVLMWFDK